MQVVTTVSILRSRYFRCIALMPRARWSPPSVEAALCAGVL